MRQDMLVFIPGRVHKSLSPIADIIALIGLRASRFRGRFNSPQSAHSDPSCSCADPGTPSDRAQRQTAAGASNAARPHPAGSPVPARPPVPVRAPLTALFGRRSRCSSRDCKALLCGEVAAFRGGLLPVRGAGPARCDGALLVPRRPSAREASNPLPAACVRAPVPRAWQAGRPKPLTSALQTPLLWGRAQLCILNPFP